jgi:hypothetical protein
VIDTYFLLFGKVGGGGIIIFYFLGVGFGVKIWGSSFFYFYDFFMS